MKRLIVSQTTKGQRSETDQRVITAMLGAGHTPDEVRSVFQRYPIGQKYREKGASGDHYLAHSIDKARAYLAVEGSPTEIGKAVVVEDEAILNVPLFEYRPPMASEVLIDGLAVRSCLTLAIQVRDKEVTTIEGLAKNGQLHPLQQAFIDHFAAQCGYCTPGMILAAKALLDRNPDPTEEEVREGLSGNLCRCTGYVQIVEAVLAAKESLR